MENFAKIKEKLEGFIKKFYVNELIKGSILFISLGLLYFLITLLIEHFLWLSSMGRTILFWGFIAGELFLLFRFIIIPLARLNRLAKGIGFKEASTMIGAYFPEVQDKLINLLQLAEHSDNSDLVMASVDQKSVQLAPVPFKIAIDYKKNTRLFWLAGIPILLFLLISLLYSTNWFTESYTRVVNYETAYQPPAPFQFLVVNDNLQALEGENFTVEVRTEGTTIPEAMSIQFEDQSYIMDTKGIGVFQYTFNNLETSKQFQLEANAILSGKYNLKVGKVPVLLDFEMQLNYPKYINRKSEVLKSTGNANIPEGTQVTWKVKTRNTDNVKLIKRDTTIQFLKNASDFQAMQTIYSGFSYDLSTSNNIVNDYDKLTFTIKAIKDQYPEIKVVSKQDSISELETFFLGKVSDDYGLTKVNLVYYDRNRPLQKSIKTLSVSKDNIGEFVTSFPGALQLEEGVDYELYFEVYDNDVLHNYKKSKSKVYTFRNSTEDEKQNQNLQQQKEAISGLNNSLSKFKKQQEELKAINKLQKEKKQLDYEDKRKLKTFLEQQEQQEKLLKKFNEQLKGSLDKTKKSKQEPFKNALKEMMERNEERLKKNEELRKELEKLADKIRKEEFSEKLDELGKENKNIEKNLDQLLELTKRFYVIEKHEKLGDQLKKLSKDQEKLANSDELENTKEKQDSINKQFDKFQKEFEELRKENKKLRKPMQLDQKKSDEKEIEEELNKASEKLGQEKKEDAKKNQKSAAEKMKQMQQQMQREMQMNGEAQQAEDVEMLRQILDNLVDYSLWQEGLMENFKEMGVNNPSYSQKLKRQSVLKENFIHIDDSLYALALRTPQISDKVTEKVTDIEYNMDKALDYLSQNQLMIGASSQQYAVTGANELAYMLSQALDQMQNGMPSKGRGKNSKGFQLPDIIKKQQELSEEMKPGGKEGKKKGEEEGQGEEGEKGKQGEQGQKGKQGNEGQEGQDAGKKGNQGQNGEEGEGTDGDKGNSGKGKSGKGNQNKSGQEGKDGNKGNSKTGDKKGSKGSKEGGEDEGEFGEERESEQIFEIYKQQQELRNKLKDKLESAGFKDEKGSRILQKMEQVEQELLQNGLNESTRKKMVDIKHELMKLEKADLEQGEDNKRESNTNQKTFDPATSIDEKGIKQYFNSVEILNRQTLPLQPTFKTKVQKYFKVGND
ncbi:hypothetical protein NBT05_05080 [Aquimarina sp. ERC-38]|uniref:DUF4175 family protein n=1 Tax=Aquimarina sp. ERC-38 TaxID=2949996 RepID=UPI002245D9F8|nr:DUF4175 family protein [Aquimarina sp. ERC-38]UZO81839.1 hypothetical protein NBT05_05080 [Aquimarina sp. ERC-38]